MKRKDISQHKNEIIKKTRVVPSLSELEDDPLYILSKKHWEKVDKSAFSAEIVGKIYKEDLSNQNFHSKVSILEVSKYLENYLWPNYSKDSPREHLISIIFMINQKHNDKLHAWDFCKNGSEALFSQFLKQVLDIDWMKKNITSFLERSAYIFFLTNCFSSFEEENIVEIIFPLCNLPMWLSIDDNLIQGILNDKNTPKKVATQYEQVKKSSDKFGENDKRFMRAVIEDFLECLKKFDMEENDDAYVLIYFERFLEFTTDLLSQIPTRRFFKFMLESMHVEEYARLSPLSNSEDESTYLFRKMLKLLNFYINFEVNEFTGNPYTETQVNADHSSKVSHLQRVAFKNFPEKLRTLALSNVSSFDNRELLAKHLSKLDREEMMLLSLKLNIIGTSEKNLSHDLVLEIFISKYEKRPSRIDAINNMPLYPTEEVFWDEKIIPDSFGYTGEAPLALPKLNLQFLSFYDFLLRSFNLYRLESAYEIKADIEKVITRLQPKLIDHVLSPTPVIRFHGWSSNAIPIKDFNILYVSKPKLGQDKPGAVVANIKISLKNFRGKIRKEWDDLRVFDVLYLLFVNEPPTKQEGLNCGEQNGLVYARGCEVMEFRDEKDRIIDNDAPDRTPNPIGDIRTIKVKLDSSQYHLDDLKKLDPSPYTSFNCVMKRKRKENNFKAVLQTLKTMINQVNDQTISVPDWFKDVFLGYGDPKKIKSVLPTDSYINFNDTFLSRDHMLKSFAGYKITEENQPDSQFLFATSIKFSGKEEIAVKYSPALNVYKKVKHNKIPYTPTQVSAIRSCLNEGLTLIVGPPGSGKTDVCVQALSLIYKNFPNQRTLVVTHSNNALNQIFDKLAALDIDGKHMIRLGHGSSSLDTEGDFTRMGRVNLMLKNRTELLEKVSVLAESIGISPDYGSTCEYALSFYKLFVYARWELYVSQCREHHPELKFPETPRVTTTQKVFQVHHSYTLEQLEQLTQGEWAKENFPFKSYFAERTESIPQLFLDLVNLFKQVEEAKVFEILRTPKERGNYIVSYQAKIVAMTCTHASLIRSKLIKECNFSFDNLVMEESAQVLELDTFIPLLLQKSEIGQQKNLRRFVLIGDHNQLPPVVKNTAFQKYSRFDQSMFSRLVRLGVPHTVLDTQGRSRPTLSKLFNWRYPTLRDLPNVQQEVFLKANAGLVYEFQLINCGNFQGKGEIQPQPYFYQNLGEAEYVVSLYIWLRLRGHPAKSITILTTYNGQKSLIRDVVRKRCLSNPKIGAPHKIATVDRFQGQQNQIILLSLVRTKSVGHIRDIRRLVVAMSRARLGLYVFCRKSLFENCLELSEVFKHLNSRPSELCLVPTESYPSQRDFREKVDTKQVLVVKDVIHLGHIVYEELIKDSSQPVLSIENNTNVDTNTNPENNNVGDENGKEDMEDVVNLVDEDLYSQNFAQKKTDEKQESAVQENITENKGDEEIKQEQVDLILEENEVPTKKSIVKKEAPKPKPKAKGKKVKEEEEEEEEEEEKEESDMSDDKEDQEDDEEEEEDETPKKKSVKKPVKKASVKKPKAEKTAPKKKANKKAEKKPAKKTSKK